MESRYSFDRLFDPDLAQAEESNFYTILMRSAFASSVRALYHEVAASGYVVQPGATDRASAQKSRIVSGLLKKSNLAEAIFGLAKAIIVGRSYAYPEGRRMFLSLDKTEKKDWFVVNDLKDIDKRRIMLRPEKVEIEGSSDNRRIIRVERWMSDPANGGYHKLSPEFDAALIELVYGDEEERMGMGRAMAEELYMLLRAYAITFKYGLQGLSRWAEGIMIGKVDPDRPASKGKTNVDLAKDLLNKLRNMRDGNVIVIPEGLADVEVKETSGTGHEMVMSMLNYLEDKAAKICLGSVMPTGGNPGSGTEARARVEAGTTTKQTAHHRRMIEAALNKTLIPTLVALNQMNFDELGCGEGEDPVIKIVDNLANDPEAVASRIKHARLIGLAVPKAWATESLGIPFATEDEETLPPMTMESNTALSHDRPMEMPKYAAKPDPIPAAPTHQHIHIEQPTPAPAPAIHVHAQMPELPDVAAAQKREAVYKAQIDEQKTEMEKQRAIFIAAMDRTIEVHVDAPIVNVAAPKVDVHVDAPPPAVVNVTAKFEPKFEPRITVEAAEAPDVLIEKPSRRKVDLIRDKNTGQLIGAEIREES